MQKSRKFEPGWILFVRRKTQLDAGQEISHKRDFKATGTYVVLRQLDPASYEVGNLIFAQGIGKSGKPGKLRII